MSWYPQVDVFKDYFGELEEESIRDNFVIIYELLDETMDFGYPQTMESKILREYITQVGVRLTNMLFLFWRVIIVRVRVMCFGSEVKDDKVHDCCNISQ